MFFLNLQVNVFNIYRTKYCLSLFSFLRDGRARLQMGALKMREWKMQEWKKQE